MNWSSHTLWGHETPNVHSPSSWDTTRTGTNRDWSLPPLWNHNSSHERLWKCDVHMTSTSLSGDWMRLSLLHSHAHFSWSNNRVSASSWFDWRPGILETFRSTFTASLKLLEVTWLAFAVTFEAKFWRFQRRKEGFHVSHLPQLFMAWKLRYPTYERGKYRKQLCIFISCELKNQNSSGFIFFIDWNITTEHGGNSIWRSLQRCTCLLETKCTKYHNF